MPGYKKQIADIYYETVANYEKNKEKTEKKIVPVVPVLHQSNQAPKDTLLKEEKPIKKGK